MTRRPFLEAEWGIEVCARVQVMVLTCLKRYRFRANRTAHSCGPFVFPLRLRLKGLKGYGRVFLYMTRVLSSLMRCSFSLEVRGSIVSGSPVDGLPANSAAIVPRQGAMDKGESLEVPVRRNGSRVLRKSRRSRASCVSVCEASEMQAGSQRHVKRLMKLIATCPM